MKSQNTEWQREA